MRVSLSVEGTELTNGTEAFVARLHEGLERVPQDKLVITESGILVQRDVALMRSRGVHAFLVGEAFMRAPDPGAALTALFG